MQLFKRLFLLIVLIMAVQSIHAAALTSFSIESSYLTNGTVVLTQNPTNIKYDFTITRGYNSSGALEDLDWVVFLVYRNANGQESQVSPTQLITGADFNGGVYFDGNAENAAIPVIDNTGSLYLKCVEYVDNGQGGLVAGPVLYSSTYYNTAGNGSIGNNGSGSTGSQAVDPFPSQYYWAKLNYGDDKLSGTSLTPNDATPVLVTGGSIYSPNFAYRLTLQADGNLVLYKENIDGTETPLWSSRTQGKQVGSLFFQTDGNLVLYAGTTETSSPVWASGIYNLTGKNTVHYAYYKLQNDGNFVFYCPAIIDNMENVTGTPSTSYIHVIWGATDTQNGVVSSHPGDVNHVLWSDPGGGLYAPAVHGYNLYPNS